MATSADERIITDESFRWEDYDETEEQVKVKPASEFMSQVIDGFNDLGENVAGSRWPWHLFDDQRLRIRQGELTIYAGHSGSYKSMIQSQVAASLMLQDERCGICSFEMRPKKTLMRFVRQCSGTDEPSIRYMHDLDRWTRGKLWFYDHLGTVDPRKLLAVCRYMAQELEIKHIFIDSLMKVMRKTDDLNEQKQFIGDLIAIAQAQNIHIHLVAHTRKPPAGGGKQTKHDIHGAGEIEKQADNVLIIQRNNQLQDGNVAAKDLASFSDEPDVWLTVAKQREGEFEGVFAMMFNGKSLCVHGRNEQSWRGVALEDRQ